MKLYIERKAYTYTWHMLLEFPELSLTHTFSETSTGSSAEYVFYSVLRQDFYGQVDLPSFHRLTQPKVIILQVIAMTRQNMADARDEHRGRVTQC